MGAPTIERVMRTRAAESEILDFKRDIYGDRDAPEWAKDVTAFANSTGGKIIIGVAEDADGCASEAVGLSVDIDKEVQRLSNWLRDLTDPDATAVTRIRGETDDQGRKFLVVDIEESAFAPHRLTVQHPKMGGQVYVRRGRDSRAVSMAQIRDLVLGTHRTQKLIQDFVNERIQHRMTEKNLESVRVAGRFPYSHQSGPNEPSVTFHVCPRRGFGSRLLVDWVLDNPDVRLGPDPTVWTPVIPNPLGALSATTRDANYTALHQLFYNGAAELHYAILGTEEWTSGDLFKRYVDEPLANIMSVMHRATGCDQFEVATWIEEVENTKLAWNADPHGASIYTSEEDSFELPPVLIRIGPDGAPLNADLRQLLDLFWRAWGLVKCPL